MDTRIKAVIGAHVAALVVAANGSFGHLALEPAPMFFLAIVFADAALLGLWGALGNARWQRRLPAVAAALFSLWCAVLYVEQHASMMDVVGFGLLIGLPCGVLVVVLSGLRGRSRQLSLQRVTEFPAREGFQFSLKQLLVATTLVAVASTVVRATRDMGVVGGWMRVLMVVLIAPPCFVLVELATFWGALGIGRRLPRLSAVITVAFLVGLVPASCFAWHGEPQKAAFFWTGLTGTTAILIAGSLLVVRFAGWRLSSADHDGE